MDIINVCLFDDSKSIIDSFGILLSTTNNIKLVAAFNEAENASEKVKTCNAHVVIMDIDMPGVSGIEAVKNIRHFNSKIAIIMFTVFDDDDKIFDSICAGASGYLLKKTEPLKIIEAIEEVELGGAPMSPGIARRVLQMFGNTRLKPSDSNYDLTQREKEILKKLTFGLSYKMIAAECVISFETVRSHIKNIYSKLHVASMTEAVAKAINENIV